MPDQLAIAVLESADLIRGEHCTRHVGHGGMTRRSDNHRVTPHPFYHLLAALEQYAFAEWAVVQLVQDFAGAL